MLLGGLFLYLSYYGCDQSQAQRLLTAKNDRAAARALALNGILRFPLVATYCGFGLLLAGLLRSDPAFAARMQGRPADSLVPAFITGHLPAGLRGLMLAAILAAAMSSIDSALNSLAAVTREDVLGRDSSSEGVWRGRLTSMGWGLFAVLAATAFARSGTGVLELVNLVGSLFYGPVLGVFTLGVFAPGVGGRWAIGALASGLATNAALAAAAPRLSWLWWNAAGWLAAVLVATLGSGSRWRRPPWSASRRTTWTLVGAFVATAALLGAISYLIADLAPFER
jgi:SSS family solute:Na+ symporter